MSNEKVMTAEEWLIINHDFWTDMNNEPMIHPNHY
jgi:hypothetical protein